MEDDDRTPAMALFFVFFPLVLSCCCAIMHSFVTSEVCDQYDGRRL
jgi:hypothetical protein